MTVFQSFARKIAGAGLVAAIGFSVIGFGHSASAQTPVIKVSAIAKTETPAGGIIDAGREYLGVKYKFGATAGVTTAFDCSSFTQYIFKLSGITLPRTSSEQATKGAKVTKDDLAVGDLLFFKDPGRAGSIGHVGIYAGDNRMLHASSSGGVKFTDITSSYYVKNYVTARRVL